MRAIPLNKILAPNSNLIERTAAELACVFYEAGRNTGLKSKHKTARAYAKANIEKFIPKTIEYFIQMLNNPNFPESGKQEIYKALLERHNDPSLQNKEQLPDIDVVKMLSLVKSNQGNDATEVNLETLRKIENAVANKSDKPKGIITHG